MSEITDRHVRIKAVEILLSGKTLDQVQVSDEMRDCIEELFDKTKRKKIPIQPQSEMKAPVCEDIAKPEPIVESSERIGFEAQYYESIKTLKYFSFLTEKGEAKKDDAVPPSFEKVMTTFKPEELEIAKTFLKPILTLDPETSFAAKVAAIDLKLSSKQVETYLDNIYRGDEGASRVISGYRVYITDGSYEKVQMTDDDLKSRFDERIKKRKALRRPYEKGMNRHKYIMPMMDSIRNNNPIDSDTCTFLDDDSALSDTGIPAADWMRGSGRVAFHLLDPKSVEVGIRFRSSVGGDILLVG